MKEILKYQLQFEGWQKCAVDCGDFVAKSGGHDRCSTTMCFESVSLHSGPIDEPVLAIGARVSIAGCVACLEIDAENLRRIFFFECTHFVTPTRQTLY